MTTAPPAPRSELTAKPWFGLSYLFFAYLPLLFWTDRPLSAVVATVAVTLAFLPAHFLFYRDRPALRLPLTLYVAALASALVPFSTSGTTFTVYATAMACARQPPRRAVWLSVGFVVVSAAEVVWLYSASPVFVATTVAMTAVTATLVAATILHTRARNARDAELRLTQEEVKRLAGMAERERIGRDLHDLLGHTLSVVALKSELAGKLVARDPAGAEAQMKDVEQIARAALSQVREAVTGMRAAGLQAELAAARLALLSAEVHLDQRLAPLSVDDGVERVLGFALREAVTNVLRHAAARRVEVELTADPVGARLTISDDGKGGVERSGQGLTGMSERLEAIGGTLEVESPRGAGTRLVIRTPLSAPS